MKANSRQIPSMFYLNGRLHKKLKIVKSDDSVVAWCYEDAERVWYPRSLVRQEFKRAYTIPGAANLMRVSTNSVKDVYKTKLLPMPECTYDLNSFRPLKSYVSEDDMLDLRQAIWDMLPKNRFGEPKNDTMTSEPELISLMHSDDERNFIITNDNEIIQIFRA